MSSTEALIRRGQRHVIHARAQQLLDWEAAKGTRTSLSLAPTHLEPRYSPIYMLGPEDTVTQDDTQLLAQPPVSHDLVLLEAWIPAPFRLDWQRAERFVRQASRCQHRFGLEIGGNEDLVQLCLLVHHEDEQLMCAVARAEFSGCQFVRADPKHASARFARSDIFLYDVHPTAPYSHRFTAPEQLLASPFEAALGVLASIPAEARGFVQILAEPAQDDWHSNVQTLINMEYMAQLTGESGSVMRTAQQAPSADLRNMSMSLEAKAHNDKPFFFAAIRVGIEWDRSMEGPPTQHDIRPLTSFLGLLQVGGRKLCHLTEIDYRKTLGDVVLWQMLERGLSYRPGFLVNSEELTGLIHLPSGQILEDSKVCMLETLPPEGDELTSGTRIGTSQTAGTAAEVCIPDHLRPRGVHIIGTPGTGKSALMRHMILTDIENRRGALLLDPHGDLAEDVISRVPEEHADRVLYLDMGDPEWVPRWNPVRMRPGQDLRLASGELVKAIKGIVNQAHWGDRLEHLLRHGIYGLLHLQDVSLYDLGVLLQPEKNGDEERRRLHAEILQAVTNETALRFWQRQLGAYHSADFSPVQHKLSKLLMGGGAVGPMVTQTDNQLDLRDFMDSDQVLIINLSGVGSDTRDVLGAFIFSLVYLATLSRADQKRNQRRQFHVYADEGHLFVPEALEGMLAESRKYNVALTIAHQYMRQFRDSQRDALASTGTSLIFGVDQADARYLQRSLRGKVKDTDLNGQGVGQVICRIDTQIVRITTQKPSEQEPEKHCRDQIIAQSRERLCIPAAECRSRAGSLRPPVADLGIPDPDFKPVHYDGLD